MAQTTFIHKTFAFPSPCKLPFWSPKLLCAPPPLPPPLPFSLILEWHISLNCPVGLWVSYDTLGTYICNKLCTFSPVHLSLLIWVLAQLVELRRWKKRYISMPPQDEDPFIWTTTDYTFKECSWTKGLAHSREYDGLLNWTNVPMDTLTEDYEQKEALPESSSIQKIKT